MYQDLESQIPNPSRTTGISIPPTRIESACRQAELRAPRRKGSRGRRERPNPHRTPRAGGRRERPPRLASRSLGRSGGGGLASPHRDGFSGGGVHGGCSAVRRGGHRHHARPHLPPPAPLRRAHLPALHRPHHIHGPALSRKDSKLLPELDPPGAPSKPLHHI